MGSVYMGPPLRNQTPPRRIYPPHLAVYQADVGEHLHEPEKPLQSFNGGRTDLASAPVPRLPDPPGAQARTTRGGRGPRPDSRRGRVLAWVARQPGPVRAPEILAAVEGAISPDVSRLAQTGHLQRRRYYTKGRICVVQYAPRGRPWPPLPTGATLDTRWSSPA